MKRKVALTLLLKSWSTLTNSSRQLVGSVDEALKEVLPGNWLLVPGINGQSAKEGGLTVMLGHRSLKFPWRSASEGTRIPENVDGTRSLRHSSDQKKYVLVLKIGPPIV